MRWNVRVFSALVVATATCGVRRGPGRRDRRSPAAGTPAGRPGRGTGPASGGPALGRRSAEAAAVARPLGAE